MSKIPLPKYLKMLTENGVPVKKAMELAGKLYKTCNTPEQLAALNDLELQFHKITEKEDRKLFLTALRNAGYTASSSSIAPHSPETTPTKKKRKRDAESSNIFLPTPKDEASTFGSMDFKEILDIEALQRKSAVINRAPIMSAWAMVVAERQGFHREEALSIASVYTEMNALSKGVSLGIYKDGKQKGIEASRNGAQPYVELMGRRPLYETQNNQWRALLNSSPALPSAAYSYISRSLRQTAPFIIGAMRLLAASYTPSELNEKGFNLYTQFRPVVTGWGERAEIKCNSILSLRKKSVVADTADSLQDTVPASQVAGDDDVQEPPDKMRKIMYEEVEEHAQEEAPVV